MSRKVDTSVEYVFSFGLEKATNEHDIVQCPTVNVFLFVQTKGVFEYLAPNLHGETVRCLLWNASSAKWSESLLFFLDG